MATVLGFLELCLIIAAAWFAWLAIDGGAKFAAYAAFATACLPLLEWFRRKSTKQVHNVEELPAVENKKNNIDQPESRVPDKWQGIVPQDSNYEFYTETIDAIPLGLQSFSFEYGPHGHSKALTLTDSKVIAQIQFSCRIINVYRAMFEANEFALNIVQPMFLVRARSLLEKYSSSALRKNREEIAQQIIDCLSPAFEEVGVKLESVVIGSIDTI